MAFALEFTVKGDAPAAVRAVELQLRPERIRPVIGRSATKTIRDHLFGLNLTRPNQLGGKRTNYYQSAARATQFQIVGDSVIVSTNWIGMALRYFGGTVTAGKGLSYITGRPTKYLTIPCAPESHGKRASEFKDLVLVFGPGGVPIGLATKGSRAIQITQNARGAIVKKAIGRIGVMLFRLVTEATFKPDPTVLPEDATLYGNIDRDVGQVVDRAWERGQAEGAN